MAQPTLNGECILDSVTQMETNANFEAAGLELDPMVLASESQGTFEATYTGGKDTSPLLTSAEPVSRLQYSLDLLIAEAIGTDPEMEPTPEEPTPEEPTPEELAPQDRYDFEQVVADVIAKLPQGMVPEAQEGINFKYVLEDIDSVFSEETTTMSTQSQSIVQPIAQGTGVCNTTPMVQSGVMLASQLVCNYEEGMNYPVPMQMPLRPAHLYDVYKASPMQASTMSSSRSASASEQYDAHMNYVPSPQTSLSRSSCHWSQSDAASSSVSSVQAPNVSLPGYRWEHFSAGYDCMYPLGSASTSSSQSRGLGTVVNYAPGMQGSTALVPQFPSSHGPLRTNVNVTDYMYTPTISEPQLPYDFMDKIVNTAITGQAPMQMVQQWYSIDQITAFLDANQVPTPPKERLFSQTLSLLHCNGNALCVNPVTLPSKWGLDIIPPPTMELAESLTPSTMNNKRQREEAEIIQPAPPPKKRHICELCDRLYSARSSLNTHMAKKHAEYYSQLRERKKQLATQKAQQKKRARQKKR